MGYRILFLLLAFILFPFVSLEAQTKTVGECTLQYAITQLTTSDTIGSKWVFVKGDVCKTILTTPQLVQTLLFNVQQSSATITKDIGSSHFLQDIVYPPVTTSTLLSMKEMFVDSTVTILGYACKGVEQRWSDGVIYQIWYTPEIATTVNAFELAFKEVPGLVLSYTIIPVNGASILYKAEKMDLSPIPLSQLNINRERYQNID